MNDPVIKWSGSKRSQAKDIVNLFPKMETYYDPFLGGGSIMREVLERNLAKRCVCSDLDANLIGLWIMIRENPEKVLEHYSSLWEELNKDNDLDRKKKYFAEIRNRLNVYHNPLDFMFIMRTCTNGMPRYNKNGEFNNSFHVTRNGIEPKRLAPIIKYWHSIIQNVEFVCCSFEFIRPSKDDFVYIDPPYANTKGMYQGGFRNDKLFEWVRSLPCRYAMSYDGVSGRENKIYDVPSDLYHQHILLKSGNSSFKRVIGKDRSAMVYESLYMK